MTKRTEKENRESSQDRGWVGGLMDQARQVLGGMSNLAADVKPIFYEGRRGACLGCSELIVHERHVEGSVGRYQCRVCGCLMEAKWRSEGARCPLDKWSS